MHGQNLLSNPRDAAAIGAMANVVPHYSFARQIARHSFNESHDFLICR
jgi:hypothetical protein